MQACTGSPMQEAWHGRPCTSVVHSYGAGETRLSAVLVHKFHCNIQAMRKQPGGTMRPFKELAEVSLHNVTIIPILSSLCRGSSDRDLLICAIISSLTRVCPGNEVDLRVGSHSGRSQHGIFRRELKLLHKMASTCQYGACLQTLLVSPQAQACCP